MTGKGGIHRFNDVDDFDDLREYDALRGVQQEFKDIKDNKVWCEAHSEISMTILGVQNLSALDESLFDKLYDLGVDAPFGDMSSHSTRVDFSVRRGKEVLPGDAWNVPASFCKFLEDTWHDEKMEPCDVEVRPYKMNLYRQGDKFDEHSDTPAPNLVGTILVGLLEDNLEGCFFIRHGQESARWSIQRNNTFMFYSDCPHYVDAMHGPRATLSFKVFSKQVQDDSQSEKSVCNNTFQFAVDELLEAQNGTVGLVLSHGYNLHASDLKGKDKLVHKLLFSMPGVDTVVIPVMVCLSAKIYKHDSGDSSATCDVYALRDEDLCYVVSKMKGLVGNQPSKLPTCDFFYLQQGGFKVKHHTKPFVGYCGNEASPGCIESVYVQRAFIVSRVPCKEEEEEEEEEEQEQEQEEEEEQEEEQEEQKAHNK